ncbi:MAG: hypothetical protein NWQ19_08715 [Nonlabens sp.]|nr:hypothetical protein [Nonlabens sp.]
MKNILFTLIAICSLISCNNQKNTTVNEKTSTEPTSGKVENLQFPEDFLGIYKGTLTITTSNGDELLPMEFHLLDAPDKTRYGYKIFYGAERDERSYNLVRTHNEHLFLVDENNGIILESGFANNTLFSTYEVMGNLLNSTEKFYEDRMEFTITMAREQDTSITGTKESAIVKNYPISIMQTATLIKEKKSVVK